MATLRLQEIIVGSKDKSNEIGKMEKEGLIKKIAPRLYTSNLSRTIQSGLQAISLRWNYNYCEFY